MHPDRGGVLPRCTPFFEDAVRWSQAGIVDQLSVVIAGSNSALSTHVRKKITEHIDCNL
jgi:hypothetical protein